MLSILKKQETTKDVAAELDVPTVLSVNMKLPLPPKPVAYLSFSSFLTNTGKDDVVLHAPTPCDVENWILLDSQGKILDSDKPETCIQIPQGTTIKAGEVWRHDGVIKLNARILNDGQKHKLVFSWWLVPAEAEFTVKFIK